MPIIEGMSFEDYLAIDADSNSANKLIRQSPAHYKYREEDDYDTRAKQIGSAIHCALLEPERFSSYYLVAEADVRTDAHYKGLAKDVGGHRVLTRPEHRRVLNMQASAYRNKRFAGYMKRMGRNELTVISADPVTGVPVKVRFDRMGDSPWALDIKKCQDARADEFIRAISNYGYYMQVAFYRDVWFWETGEHLEEFPLVAIEEKAPHGVICHDLDDVAIMLGRKHYREALDTYARCREKGEWPSYEEESEVVSVTSWLANDLFDEFQVWDGE